MLQASDLTKAHDGAPLFDGLSFVLGDGERAGLVGPNGVGKSTLLRLLAGRRSPRPRRGRHRRAASASAGCPRRRRTRARRSASCSAPGWARCGPCAASCDALLARLADGDTSPATLERYGHAQERFEALGGWALEASLDEARRALGIDHLDPARRWRGCRAASRRARCWPGRCWRRRPCCCSTSPPTTSTATACTGWRSGCAASPARSSSSPTTARSSTPSSAASSSSSPVVR